MSEHRDPAVLLKVKEIERSKAEAERLAYIDPALSDKARDEGNTLFKVRWRPQTALIAQSGDFAGSVKLYTEAIKRNPDDARGYTNRAAAYTKLLALSEALKDAESAIKADPTFGALARTLVDLTRAVKGYIRKSHVKFAMREYDAAATAIEAVRQIATACEAAGACALPSLHGRWRKLTHTGPRSRHRRQEHVRDQRAGAEDHGGAVRSAGERDG